MGVSTTNNQHDLPRRSSSVLPKGRSRPAEVISTAKKKNKTQLRSKPWCLLSLCPGNTKDAKIENTFNNNNNPPSLAQFLALERRANNGGPGIGRDHCPIIYGPDDGLALAQPVTEPNSLFVDGCVVPPRSTPLFRSGLMENGSKGCGVPFLLYCICGQDIHWIDSSLNFLCFLALIRRAISASPELLLTPSFLSFSELLICKNFTKTKKRCGYQFEDVKINYCFLFMFSRDSILQGFMFCYFTISYPC